MPSWKKIPIEQNVDAPLTAYLLFLSQIKLRSGTDLLRNERGFKSEREAEIRFCMARNLRRDSERMSLYNKTSRTSAAYL